MKLNFMNKSFKKLNKMLIKNYYNNFLYICILFCRINTKISIVFK